MGENFFYASNLLEEETLRTRKKIPRIRVFCNEIKTFSMSSHFLTIIYLDKFDMFVYYDDIEGILFCSVMRCRTDNSAFNFN